MEIITAKPVGPDGKHPDSIWGTWVVVPPVNGLTAQQAARSVADALQWQLQPEQMRSLSRVQGDPLRTLFGARDVDRINLALDRLYTWADAARVWIEMTDPEPIYDDKL